MVTRGQDEGPAPKRARPSTGESSASEVVPISTDSTTSSAVDEDHEVDSFMEPLSKILEKHSRLGDRLFFLSDDFMSGLGSDAVLSLPAGSQRIQGIGPLAGEYIFPLAPPQKFLINVGPKDHPEKWKLATLQETARTEKEILYVKRSLKSRVYALIQYQDSFLSEVSGDQMIGTVGRSETVTREMSVPHANRPVYAWNMNFPSTSSIVSSAMVESVPEAQLDRPSAPSPVASGSWQVNTAVDVPHVQVAHVAKIEAKDTKVFQRPQQVAPAAPPSRQAPQVPVAARVAFNCFPFEDSSAPGKTRLARDGRYNVWIDEAKLRNIESTNYSGKAVIRALMNELLALGTDGSTALLRKRSANGGGITNLVSSGFNNALKQYAKERRDDPKFVDLRVQDMASFAGGYVKGFA